ncbi:MAG TPA: hypothetical protein VK522_09275 [Pseudolabrys sp.]|nr:hypothetical protein [Pseudolabrys sp.]
MRAIVLAAVAAAGIAMAGVSGASAAPASGLAIGDNANQNSNVAQVQHWRWGSRGRGGHYRWGSRGRGGGWGRCHFRYRSGFYRC